MNRLLSMSILLAALSAQWCETSFAQSRDQIITAGVTEVTQEYIRNGDLIPPGIIPTPTPTGNKPNDPLPPMPPVTPTPSGSTSPSPSPSPTTGTIDIGGTIGTVSSDIGQILVIGEKIWGYIISMKPHGDFKPVSASVVPPGITDWRQLTYKQLPIVKVYRVHFKNLRGKDAGGFDYEISYVPGGAYKGKGKYIGQITTVPRKIKLKTDRSVSMKAEVLNPLNYGTEDDPVAAITLQVSWTTPTTTRFEGNTAEYFILGNGDFHELSSPNE